MTLRSTIYSLLRRECNRIKRFTPYGLLLTVLPAISILFFATIFLNGIPNSLPIALLDQDNSTLSRTLQQMIDATPEVQILSSVSDLTTAQQLLRQGSVDAIVLIPPSFEHDIYTLSPTSVEAYISGANILKNGLISKGLLTTATTFNAAISLQTLQGMGLSPQQAMAQVVPITIDKHTLFNPFTNYDYYLSPLFMPMMIIIFAMLATIFAIGSELRYATAKQWLSTARGSLPVALIGKLAPIYIAMCVWGWVAFFTLFYIMDIPLRGSAWMLIVGGGVVVMAYMCLAICIISTTANMRLALSLGGGYTVMSFSLCGLTYPTMAMHSSIQILSKFFPFTYFAELVVEQAVRGTPTAYSLHLLGSMTLFVLPALCLLPRLRQVTTNRTCFGRE